MIPVTGTVTLSNPGPDPISLDTLQPVSGADSLAFTVGAGTCTIPGTLAVGASCSLSVAFTPPSAGAFTNAYFYVGYTAAAFSGWEYVYLQGVGTAPGSPLVYLPTSLDFFTWNAGVVTYDNVVTVTNPDTVAQAITGITATPAPWVLVSENCTPSIPSGGTCDIVVHADLTALSPTGPTAYPGTITVSKSVSADTIPLSITVDVAVPPSASIVVSPNPVQFPTGPQGTPVQQVVTAQNVGAGASPGLSFVSGNPDVQVTADGCASPLATGASCTFTVTNTRATLGALSFASVTVQSTDTLPVYYTNLSVLGLTVTVAPGTLEASPTSLAFGTTLVGTDSTPIDISAGNTGDLALDITSIVSSSPDFVVSTTCPVSPSQLLAKTCCPVTVTFHPTAAGTSTGTLTFNGAAGPLKTVSLSGTGQAVTAPVVTKAFTPSSIMAGGVSTLSITVTNANPAALTNAALLDTFPAGLFVAATPAPTNSCGGTLTAAAGSSSVQLAAGTVPAGSVAPGTCTIDVPVSAPALSPGLVNTIPAGAFTSALGNSVASATATLLVTAAPTPAISLSTNALNFGAQTVSTTSPAQTVVVTSAGTAPLSVTGIAATGDYSTSSACTGSPLAPSSTCNIAVTFTPIIAGSRPGDVMITSNDPASPHIVTLSGLGVAAPLASVSLIPSSLAFPSTTAGQASAPQVVTLSNTGGATVDILAIEVLGSGFSGTHNCRRLLASPGSCRITVTFAPAAAGSFTGRVRVTTNAPGSPHIATLTGSATAASVGRLVADPASISFPDQTIGTTSGSRAFTISNGGNATATISRISVTGDFAVEGTCSSLAPGASCAFLATFAPTAIGPRSGQVVVTSNASNSPFSVGLNGLGVPVPAPRVSLSATALGFGNRLVGSSATQTVTVTNDGTADLVFGPVESTGDFRITNGCTGTLAPTRSCAIAVEFVASIPGSRLGDVSITSNASGSPHRVTLSGVGCRLASTGRGFELVCGP